MEPVYTPVIAVAKTMFRLFAWQITVSGAEHIPAQGGAVLATNHVGYLDFTFVGYGALQRNSRLVRYWSLEGLGDRRSRIGPAPQKQKTRSH